MIAGHAAISGWICRGEMRNETTKDESRKSGRVATSEQSAISVLWRRLIRPGAWVGAAILIAVGIRFVRSGKQAHAPLVAAPLTSDMRKAGHPSFSPDRNQVVEAPPVHAGQRPPINGGPTPRPTNMCMAAISAPRISSAEVT